MLESVKKEKEKKVCKQFHLFSMTKGLSIRESIYLYKIEMRSRYTTTHYFFRTTEIKNSIFETEITLNSYPHGYWFFMKFEF